MTNQFSGVSQGSASKFTSSEDGFRERRQGEMKRRFEILQARRSHLERELATIKALLLSLDNQMRHYSDYEQLSLHR